MRTLLLVLSLVSARCFAGDGIVAKSTLVPVNPYDYQIFSVLFDDQKAVVGMYALDHDVLKANFALCRQTAGVYSGCVTGADRWFAFTPGNLDDLSFNFGLNLDLAAVLVAARASAAHGGQTIEAMLLAGQDMSEVERGINGAKAIEPAVKNEYRRVFKPDGLLVQTIRDPKSVLTLSEIESVLLFTIGEWAAEGPTTPAPGPALLQP